MPLPPIHPELQAAVKRAPKITFRRWSLPIMRRLIAWTARSAKSDAVAVTTVKSEGVTARVFRPTQQTPRGALLWFHGGGYIMGVPKMETVHCTELAERLGLIVVTPTYRLAPEHPFPAAHDDAHAAYHWLLAMLEAEPGPTVDIVVGGESAGGGLAAGLVQRLVDDKAPRLKGQLLIYPMLDDATAADRTLDDEGHALWNNTSNRLGWTAYLGADPGSDVVAPYAVPARRQTLAGLPPTWIGVGTCDLFHAECHRYAERLRAENVACTFDSVEGGVHGFEVFDRTLVVCRTFVDSQIAFLNTCFGEEPRAS